VAQEDNTIVLILDRGDYDFITENGFDGDVKQRMTLLRTAPALAATLKATNLRTLAFATSCETYRMGDVVYRQGAEPAAMYLILQGECKIYVASGEGGHGPVNTRAAGGGSPSRRSAAPRRVDIAVLGPGDVCGAAPHSLHLFLSPLLCPHRRRTAVPARSCAATPPATFYHPRSAPSILTPS
jgi:CRP-like cAMP-binding protein